MAIKATANNLTMMQKHLGVDREQKRLKMFKYVAKEMLGRALARKHKEQGKQFAWDKFAAKFDAEYKNYNAEQMLEEILTCSHWITNEQAVIDLYYQYMDDYNRNNGNNKENNDDDEFVAN